MAAPADRLAAPDTDDTKQARDDIRPIPRTGRTGLQNEHQDDAKPASGLNFRGDLNMRTLSGISISAVIALVVWFNLPTQAKQQQHDVVSMDPLAITGTVTNLPPEVYYDYSLIFPEQQ